MGRRSAACWRVDDVAVTVTFTVDGQGSDTDQFGRSAEHGDVVGVGPGLDVEKALVAVNLQRVGLVAGDHMGGAGLRRSNRDAGIGELQRGVGEARIVDRASHRESTDARGGERA